ncbi:MAG: preprotein translocase subunit SecE [Planctomycetota bacterium]|jgi:preprotein translocase SecE subunit
MEAGIYKKGQGYWTRLMSAIALGTLIAMGALWIWNELKRVRIEGVEPVFVSAAGATIFALIFGIIGFILIGRKQRVVDFMIATEGEMKKVNWSTRREILGSTWVVIGLTIFIALLCFVVDLLFQRFFMWIDVLESTA